MSQTTDRAQWETLTRQLLNESKLFTASGNDQQSTGVFSAKLKGVYAKALESHLRIHEQAQKAQDKAEATEEKIRSKEEREERIKKSREARAADLANKRAKNGAAANDELPEAPPVLTRTSTQRCRFENYRKTGQDGTESQSQSGGEEDD